MKTEDRNKQPSNGRNVVEDAQEAIAIDPLALDKECVRLPSHIFRFAQLVADLRADTEQHKRELEVVEADLSKKVRLNPEKHGLEKITESAVTSVVTTHPAYKDTFSNLQKARHELDIAQAAVSALEAKKRSLTMLVELHGLNYFSSPALSQKGQESVRRMTKDALRPKRRDMED